MSTVICIAIFGSPLLSLALFVSMLRRKHETIKSMENTLGFFSVMLFFTVVIIIVFLGFILSHHRGFIGYYLWKIDELKDLFLEGKPTFVLYFLNFISLHAIGFLPFLSTFQFIRQKNKLYKLISNIDETSKGEIFVEKLVKYIQAVKNDMKIEDNVEIKILEGNKELELLGHSRCAILKNQDSVYLVINKNFLELLSKGIFSEEEFKAILYHEFAHIKNKDYFIPLLSRVILNKRFSLIMYFSFSIFMATLIGMIFLSGKIHYFQKASPFLYLLWPLVLPLLLYAPSYLISGGMYLISISTRRCEVFADYLASRFISSKVLKNAIIKTGIFSESGNLLASNFSSSSDSTFVPKKRNPLQVLLYIFKKSNIFIEPNHLYFHPSLSHRVKALDYTRIVIEDTPAGLINRGIFASVVCYSIGTMLLLYFHMIPVPRHVAHFSFSLIAPWWCVLFACLPLRYAQNPFIFNEENVRLTIAYSFMIALGSSPHLVIKKSMLIGLMTLGDPLEEIAVSFLRLGSLIRFTLVFGLSLLLFCIFLSIGNFFIKRKLKMTIQRV